MWVSVFAGLLVCQSQCVHVYLGVSVCVICVYDFVCVCVCFSADSWHCQCAECLAVFRISMIIEESLFSYIYYLPVPITQFTQPAVSPSHRKNTPSVLICFLLHTLYCQIYCDMLFIQFLSWANHGYFYISFDRETFLCFLRWVVSGFTCNPK